MKNTYTRGDYELPRCTNIISDCSPKNWGMQWGANETVKWIKENCLYFPSDSTEPGHWEATDEDLDDARFHYRNVSKKATDIGSEVHNLIERHLKNQSTTNMPISIQADKAFHAFLMWEKKNDLNPISLEQTVYGDYWAGTLDFYGYFNGKLYVIDFKSSKAHYSREHCPQVAAYRSAKEKEVHEQWAGYDKDRWENEFINELPVGNGVLRLDKETGLPDWKDYSKRYERDLNTFNWMVGLYFAQHPVIRKNAGWKE